MRFPAHNASPSAADSRELQYLYGVMPTKIKLILYGGVGIRLSSSRCFPSPRLFLAHFGPPLTGFGVSKWGFFIVAGRPRGARNPLGHGRRTIAQLLPMPDF